MCQAKQCSDQGIHYLTPDSLQENVRTFVKCERNDELREIITREAYWYQESNLPLNGICHVITPSNVFDFVF